VKETAELAGRFPEFTFMPLGALIPTATPKDAFEEHELFDRRRAEGMKAARGRLIAILEDRGAPKPDWVRAMVDEHEQKQAAAIGGGMQNAALTSMGRALFACDCGRYQPPFQEGEVEYASDLNICYTREALESVRHLWTDRYQETRVNWALRDSGKRLLLSSRPIIVHKRGPQKLSRVLGERMHWGRVFAIQRGERWTAGRSLIAVAGTIVLPAILLLRHTRAMKAKGWSNGELMSALPSFLMILPAWSLGEALGYLDAAFGARQATPAH
jgi:GT2 family glycosyltransferase